MGRAGEFAGWGLDGICACPDGGADTGVSALLSLCDLRRAGQERRGHEEECLQTVAFKGESVRQIASSSRRHKCSFQLVGVIA